MSNGPINPSLLSHTKKKRKKEKNFLDSKSSQLNFFSQFAFTVYFGKLKFRSHGSILKRPTFGPSVIFK